MIIDVSYTTEFVDLEPYSSMAKLNSATYEVFDMKESHINQNEQGVLFMEWISFIKENVEYRLTLGLNPDIYWGTPRERALLDTLILKEDLEAKLKEKDSRAKSKI